MRFGGQLGLTLALGLLATGCGGDRADPPLPKPKTQLEDPALRKLERQAGIVLDGGPEAFRARLRELRGTPVVVNQWASWCPSCQYEFPYFARMALKYRGRVAFLGVDSNDSRSRAEGFSKRHPVPFPHYYDPDVKIARIFRGGIAWPTTAFYAADGKLVYTRPGGYPKAAELEADIRRYLEPAQGTSSGPLSR